MQSILEKATSAIMPSTYLDYRLYLDSLYHYIKAEAGRYSYHKFAEDLGFDKTTVMHQIVRGYRPLTPKAADKVAKALRLPAAEHRYLLCLVDYVNAKTAAQRQKSFEQILDLKAASLSDRADADLLAYFKHWYHPVIWEMVGSAGFINNPAWIAARIVPPLVPEQVKESLELLLRLGLIKPAAEGLSYVQTQNRISTGHRVKGLGLTAYHQQMLERASEALVKVDSQRRDISAVTLAVSEETAQKLRRMIHAFQLQLLDEAERSGGGEQIYQVNIQLFPFTK